MQYRERYRSGKTKNCCSQYLDVFTEVIDEKSRREKWEKWFEAAGLPVMTEADFILYAYKK